METFAGPHLNYFQLGGIEGEEKHEVSPVMVATIATAVRIFQFFLVACHLIQLTQIYAVLNDWKEGEHKQVKFYADTYFETYDLHIATLDLFKYDHRVLCHQRMSEIFGASPFVISYYARLGCCSPLP